MGNTTPISTPHLPEISQEKRNLLLEIIALIQGKIQPVEASVRSLFEHVLWVRSEIREVLTAPDAANRQEEIGDVFMTLFRLSCFRYPTKTAEEILAIYQDFPSFLRYLEELDTSRLVELKAKFSRRYAFLDDSSVQALLAEEEYFGWKWSQEVMRRMFAAEKSKEPGKDAYIREIIGETVSGEGSMSKENDTGIQASDSFLTQSILWLRRLLADESPASSKQELLRLLLEHRTGDERFFRMVFLGPVYKLFSTNHKALKITIPA